MVKSAQLGNTSTLGHCENVAWASFMANEKQHLNATRKPLLKLRSFMTFTYTIGMMENRLDHPDIACENAKERFDITQDAQDAVRSHM